METPGLVNVYYQIALFPNDFTVTDLTSFFRDLQTNLPEFNGMNQQVPIPQGAPLELPRFALRSQDGQLACDISFKKIDLFFNNPTPNPEFRRPITEILDTLSNVYNKVLQGKSVNRVGFISQFAFFEDDPVSVIKNKILTSRSITDNLEAFELSLTYTKSLPVFQHCNELIKIIPGTAVVTPGSPERRVIGIQADINTHQSEALEWTLQTTKRFVREAYNSFNIEEAYNKYF